MSRPRTRVCHLLPRLHVGGAESQVLLLLGALDPNEFELHLFLLKRGDEELEAKARALVSSVEVFDFRWRNALFSLGRMRRQLRARRIDILHCHLPLADILGRITGFVAGVPAMFTTEHGKHLWKTWPHRILDRALNRVTDVRICVSHDISELRRELEGVPPEKSPVIPNSVDLTRIRDVRRSRREVFEELRLAEDDELLIAVGRLVKAKNYPFLFRTMQRLAELRPQLHCCIAGGGPLRSALEAQIRELGIERTTHVLGPRGDVPDLLAACDVYVLSSIREGLPVALVEAMGCGKPVISTPAGGVLDLLEPDQNGILVPHDSVDDMVAGIRRLLDDRTLSTRLGEHARRTVEEGYEIHMAADRVSDLYRAALAKRAGE